MSRRNTLIVSVSLVFLFALLLGILLLIRSSREGMEVLTQRKASEEAIQQGGDPLETPAPVMPGDVIDLDIRDGILPHRERYVLRTALIIGRDRECDISVDSQTVSAKHARLVNCGQGSVGIADLHSSNGVQVNGKEIEGLARLQSGDSFTLGEAVFTITF